jgi:hypothetical protein
MFAMTRHPLSSCLLPLSLAASLLLAACNDNSSPTADFSPTPGSAPAPATPRLGNRPTELSLEERRMPLTAARECNLERVNGAIFSGTPVTVARSASVVLSGWVVDAEHTNVPATLAVRLVGNTDNRAWKAEAHTGGHREDVKTLLGGNAAYASPGFSVTIDPSALPPGTYRAYVVFDGGSGARSCDNGRAVTIE